MSDPNKPAGDKKPTAAAASRGMSRRDFLARASAGAIAPMILPSGVLGLHGRLGANDRLVTGHIGVGGMGRAHLRFFAENVGAVCDVDDNHIAQVIEGLGREVPTYKDYRRLLERDDLDAVVIAAPDHWHGLMTVHACQAGKDVYVEKPASRTIGEGRAMVEAARRYNRVVQVGSQGRSSAHAHAACTFMRNGELGQVREVVCWHVNNYVGGDWSKTSPPPPNLDWDMWLGPARWVPYNPDRVHFNFRWFMDFGGGFVRDRGAHVLSLVFWNLNLDHTGPVYVEATGRPSPTGLWDTPETMEATWRFRDPELTVRWEQPGTPVTDYDFGATYIGDRGSTVIEGADGGTIVEDHVLNYQPPAGGVEVKKSPGHQEDFVECIRTREKPIMDIEAGHRVATACTMANISYLLGRPLEWDPVAERFLNDPQANAMINPPMRRPWTLEGA